jgi:uncharacterized protein YpbB
MKSTLITFIEKYRTSKLSEVKLRKLFDTASYLLIKMTLIKTRKKYGNGFF